MKNSNLPLNQWTIQDIIDICWNHKYCSDCIFYNGVSNQGCKFLSTNPQGWARVLNLIVDHKLDTSVVNISEETPKSFLANLLGVNDDQEFEFRGQGLYRIHEGKRQYKLSNTNWSDSNNESTLVEMIQDASKITRLPHLTDAELSVCKVIGGRWVSCDLRHDEHPLVCVWNIRPIIDKEGRYYQEDAWPIAQLDADLFPSVRLGDCIEIADIRKIPG